MVTISILIHITVALALPLFRSSLSAIISLMDPSAFLIYVGALSLSALHIQPIGSGIGIGIRSLSIKSNPSNKKSNHSFKKFHRKIYLPLENLTNQNILENSITKFFDEKITGNRKYFILLKVKYLDNSVYSLHKGVL